MEQNNRPNDKDCCNEQPCGLESLNSQLQEFEKRLAVTISQANEKVQDEVLRFRAEINKSKDAVRNFSLSLRQQAEGQRKEFEDRFEMQLKRYVDCLESHEDELTELIGKATIGTISGRFQEKARAERIKGIVYLGLFYAMLCLVLVLGVAVFWYSYRNLPAGASLFDEMKTIVRRFLLCTPIYLPMFWLICHFNKWAHLKNRLVEEYEHKKVVAESYIGMSDQVESLVKKGVASAPALLGKLMAGTVDVICFNPSSSLDKIKVATPIKEVTEGMSRVVGAASNVVNAGRGANKMEK